MCRLSAYSEWIDHFECGVRYRTVISGRPSSGHAPRGRSAGGSSSGGRYAGSASPSSGIQSWSRKNCIRPVSVCHGFLRSTLTVNGEYRRPPVWLPDHSGDVMTARGCTWVSAKLMRSPDRSAARSASGSPVRSSSACQACDGDLAVGGAGQRQDRLGEVHVAGQRRPPVARPAADGAVGAAQVADGRSGDPGDALDARAEAVGERAERGHLRRGRRVVALDGDQPRHGHAGHRLALAGLPVPHRAAGLRQLVRASRASAARRRRRCACPGAPRRAGRTSGRSAENASKSVRVSHGGAIAGLNECTNGCMSVLDRSCFSYQVAAGSTTSA